MKFEAVPVTYDVAMTSKCRENGGNFTILTLVKLGKRLNHLLETCILLNVLYLK